MVAPRKPSPPGSGSSRLAPGQVRIIGGRWRGTRLPVLQADGLRPTSDRVRETLFNWLAPYLRGAVCVDLFAGTGALGLEASSRGAASVVLVEQNREVARQLRDNVVRLQADSVSVTEADALGWLGCADPGSIDIAFLDPPFSVEVWRPLLDRLLPRLAPAAMVYIESPIGATIVLPGGLTQLRHGQTREVDFRLLQAAPGVPRVTLPGSDA